jgi:hypothetical protein
LDDYGSDKHRNYPWNIHVHVGKRFYTGEPNVDDYLYADGNQRVRVEHRDDASEHLVARGAAGHHDEFLSRRHAGPSVFRLYDSGDRRHAALHFFCNRQPEFSAAA